MIRNYIRGGQTTMHLYRMFSQINRKVLFAAVIVFVLTALWLIHHKTSAYGRYIALHYQLARLHRGISGDSAAYSFKDAEDRPITLKVGHFLNHPTVQHYLNRSLAGIQAGFMESAVYTAVGIVFFMALLTWIGGFQKRSQEIRGSLFLRAEDLKKRLRKAGKASDIVIADLPLLQNSETQHILLTGTTGTGKTVYMMEIMDNIRRRGERAIVYDIAGTFIQHFYRSGQDIILDPFDPECPQWNIWQDGNDLADFEAIAASLMPLHLSGNDPFWIYSARTIFSTLAEQLRHTKHPKTAQLLEPMFSSDLNALGRLLKGTAAETLVSASVEKMALSIKSTLSTYCKSLLYLQKETKGPFFSIKQWVQQEKANSWIFIATNAEKMEALKPLISVWLDTAARAILTLAPSYDRRLWLLIDELASLHRLPSLSLLLSQGRKYGLCAASAFQDIHQIRTIYGRDEAEALFAMYNTNVFFRTKCPDTAVWMSHLTGQRERLEQREGFSYGANDVRDGVSIQQERHKEPLILETEFVNLNDLEAYVVLPGEAPITKITLQPKKRKTLVRPVRRVPKQTKKTDSVLPKTDKPVLVPAIPNVSKPVPQEPEPTQAIKPKPRQKPPNRKTQGKKAPLKIYDSFER